MTRSKKDQYKAGAEGIICRAELRRLLLSEWEKQSTTKNTRSPKAAVQQLERYLTTIVTRNVQSWVKSKQTNANE